MRTDFYVYLLIDNTDATGPTQGVFYVGKGSGTRYADHLHQALWAASDAAAEALDQRSDVPAQEARTKLERITTLQQRPGDFRVDVLADGLTEREALLVESATIDLLGLANLTNLVAGHRSDRRPLHSVTLNQLAQPLALTDHAAVVVISGLWHEGDQIEELGRLEPAEVWENAHQIWAVAAAARDAIITLAATDEPVRLLAVHKTTGGVLGGLVMGEWFIQDHQDGRFLAHPTTAPAKYLHNRLRTADGSAAFKPQPGVAYSDSLKLLIGQR
ncbi:MAG: GIY-YIG nuclease family protein [Catenulispora sp.]|nr:GIY-YIG nuclease family protein [Catenulispora sp.]NUR61436.1 GIY-YIG nuclease family protein [Catenulispora sp.]